jgi:NAD(P)-dependent dehydrogenase (short-subunit alcohol dehydrogenase family)
MAPFPSLTRKWHSEPYPSIDPTRPELSATGKIVAITGGEGSIGVAVAKAFARAGAEKIAIIGRRAESWSVAKAEIECLGAKVLAVRGDISDGLSIHHAFATVEREFGRVNIAVANAGYLSTFSPIPQADPDDWWKGFEVNTKGAFNTSRAFLAVAAPDAYLVDISTGIVHMQSKPGASSYVPSKLAATKIYETVAAENNSLHVVHIHPGLVRSELSSKAGMPAMDSGE